MPSRNLEHLCRNVKAFTENGVIVFRLGAGDVLRGVDEQDKIGEKGIFVETDKGRFLVVTEWYMTGRGSVRRSVIANDYLVVLASFVATNDADLLALNPTISRRTLRSHAFYMDLAGFAACQWGF